MKLFSILWLLVSLMLIGFVVVPHVVKGIRGAASPSCAVVRVLSLDDVETC